MNINRYGLKLKSGFTLIEAIVSNVILCGAVVTIGAISTRCLSRINIDRLYEMAASIADRQLTMIEYVGVENFLELGQMEGEFENDRVRYVWQAAVEEMEIDGLYEIAVLVSFRQHNRQYSLLVCTRLNGTSSTIQIPVTGG